RQPRGRDGLALDPEQPEVVDDHRHAQLAGDRRGDDPARPEGADGDERGRHVGGAEHPAGQVVPRQVAGLADLPHAAAGERGDHREQDRPDREGQEGGLERPDRPAEVRVDRRLQRDAPADQRGQDDRRPAVHYLASSQVSPTPTSTASGGWRSPQGAIISRSTSARTASVSSGGPSKSSSSWMVRMSRVRSPSSSSAWAQRTIASLMTSAAVPWIGVLTARRSPSERTPQLRALSSGICRRRPYSVVTYPRSRASSIVRAMNSPTFGNRAR